jgi:hypothetical protein
MIIAKMLAKIFTDLDPEAENAYQALDNYLLRLYNNILLKEKAGVDYKDDLMMYLHLSSFKSEITEIVYQQYKEEKKCY